MSDKKACAGKKRKWVGLMVQMVKGKNVGKEKNKNIEHKIRQAYVNAAKQQKKCQPLLLQKLSLSALQALRR